MSQGDFKSGWDCGPEHDSEACEKIGFVHGLVVCFGLLYDNEYTFLFNKINELDTNP